MARTVLFRPPGERLQVEVLSASVSEAPNRTAEVRTRVQNPQPGDLFLAPTDIQLLVDGTPVNPSDELRTVIRGRTDQELALIFDLAAEPRELVLVLRFGEDEGNIPLLGSFPPIIGPPALRPDAAAASVGFVDALVGPPSIVELSDRFVVSVPVVITNRDQYDKRNSTSARSCCGWRNRAGGTASSTSR